MSEFAQWYLEKSGEIMNGIGARTNEKIQGEMDRMENLEGLDISFLQIGFAFDPEPITPEDFIARSPYGKPAAFQEEMDASVGRGWLLQDKNSGYILTTKGKQAAKEFIASGSDLFGNLPGLTEAKNRRISDLLEVIVRHAQEITDLSKKPALEIGRRLEPPPEAAPMLRIRRYLTDIAYFREDVHIASWQGYGVNGQLWETLTYLWREEVQTAAEIAEQLSQYRKYEEEDYAASLDELAVRGWAAGEDGKYAITDKGKKVRQGAEDKTDQLYAAAFEVLPEADSKELKALLVELAEVIQVPEEEDESED